MWGIDVSKHNGGIDWKKVKESGCGFAIIRAGYGMFEAQIDEQFLNNVNGCMENNIPFGVYWFSYASSAADALKEAQVCEKIVSPYLTNISLPIFYDFEYDSDDYAYNKNGQKLTSASRTNIIYTFCNYFKEKGIKIGYYTNKDYYTTKILPKKLPFTLWLAQYNENAPEYNAALVQRKSTSKIPGIYGAVDYNENISLDIEKTFISDTTNDEKNPVKIEKYSHYTIKITGEDVELICGISSPPSPQFAVIRCRREGYSTFWHVVAIGDKGNQAGIYVNGGPRVCVCEVV